MVAVVTGVALVFVAVGSEFLLNALPTIRTAIKESLWKAGLLT